MKKKSKEEEKRMKEAQKVQKQLERERRKFTGRRPCQKILAICPVCGKQEKKDGGLPWIQCDRCHQWIHIRCSNIPDTEQAFVHEEECLFVIFVINLQTCTNLLLSLFV